jgi:hypothetical protein
MSRAINLVLLLSGVVTVAGVIVSVVYFFQPWRNCPYEDRTVGCAVLPQDAQVMAIAVISALIAAIVFAVCLVKKRARSAA